MATATINYASPAAFDINLQNLAASSTFVGGRSSAEIDNATSTKYVDAYVTGVVHVGTSPGTSGIIAVYVWGSDVSAATRNIDTIGATDADVTLSATGMLGALRLGASIAVNLNTSNVDWPIPPFSVASLFGGVMPRYWGLYVTQSTASPLYNNAVNDNPLSWVGVKYDVA